MRGLLPAVAETRPAPCPPAEPSASIAPPGPPSPPPHPPSTAAAFRFGCSPEDVRSAILLGFELSPRLHRPALRDAMDTARAAHEAYARDARSSPETETPEALRGSLWLEDGSVGVPSAGDEATGGAPRPAESMGDNDNLLPGPPCHASAPQGPPRVRVRGDLGPSLLAVKPAGPPATRSRRWSAAAFVPRRPSLPAAAA